MNLHIYELGSMGIIFSDEGKSKLKGIASFETLLCWMSEGSAGITGFEILFSVK